MKKSEIKKQFSPGVQAFFKSLEVPGTLFFLFSHITSKRKLVVLKLPYTVAGILKKAQHIHDQMLNNPRFPVTNPSMDLLQDHIDDAFTKEANMLGGNDPDKTNNRNEALFLVVTDLEKLRMIVHIAVNNNKNHAQEIASSAGMDLRGYTKKGKQQWGAYYTGITGEIELQGEYVVERSAYQWQATETPEIAESWKTIDIDPTIKSITVVKGLIPGSLLYFRYRIIVSSGPKAWSIVLCMAII